MINVFSLSLIALLHVVGIYWMAHHLKDVNNAITCQLLWTVSPDPYRFTRSDIKVRELVTFFDIRGIVHYESVPTGRKVNQVYYLEVPKVRRKRPELVANNSWILHHDNAPAHTALSVRELLASKQTTVLEHPPYLPDLATNDFFCSRW
jgi:hypothetical protein